MHTKIRPKSPILEAVHETAKDLKRHGFISKRDMTKYDLLCLRPVTAHDSLQSEPCASIKPSGKASTLRFLT